MQYAPSLQALLAEVAQRSPFRSLPGLRHHYSTLLGGFPVAGKRVLEIGCGGGQLSLLMACEGAAEVLGLEPLLDGSNRRSVHSLERLQDGGEMPNLRILREPLGPELVAEGPFDLIVGVNLINHLHETEADLRQDPASREEYLRLFALLRRLLRPEGACIFSDCSRRNAWRWAPRIGLRHPFTPTINWCKHQAPSVWGELFREAGFSGYSVEWMLPRRFGLQRNVRSPAARALLSWLWTSSFVLRVTH